MTGRAGNRVDTASGLVAASPDVVTSALLDPDQLMQWLPPQGMSGRVLLFEPQAGGGYRIELTHRGEGEGKSSARTDLSSGRFLVLEPGRRIVMSVEFDSDDPRFAGEMIMSWSFFSEGEDTWVTITAENVPPGISAEDHAVGLKSSLDNLARFVRR